jgi:hypothetical protein
MNDRPRNRPPSIRRVPGARPGPRHRLRRTAPHRRLHLAVLAGRGQSTVEYALVLLGAAALALLVVSWVTGTDVVGRLFEAVFGRILRQAG